MTMESRYPLDAGFRLQGPREGRRGGTRVCQPPSWFQAGVCVRRGAGPPTYPEHEWYENMYYSAWGKGGSHGPCWFHHIWWQAGSQYPCWFHHLMAGRVPRAGFRPGSA